MIKLVCGVGINDADYVVCIKETISSINGKQKRKLLWVCPFYRAWTSMVNRCYNPKVQDKYSTYKGCYVCDDWHLFSNFKGWMEQQDWEGKQLDKDILLTCNKMYGPDTCVFVSGTVNSFVTDHTAERGEWPIGVYWKRQNQKFVAQCKNPFTRKLEYLGCFFDPDEAHDAWLTRKREFAEMLAAEQDDARVAKALVDRYENYV